MLPAAGIGRRMQSDIPKQYLPLSGKTILEHTLDSLLKVERVRGIVLALQPGDPYWPGLRLDTDKPVLIAAGGRERCHSVLNALYRLLENSSGEDACPWALVHDAVRPCVRADDINRLIDASVADEHGGLLAMPVKDTLKRQAPDGRVAKTVDRTELWHALTPQLFRADLLRDALESAIRNGVEVTDESSAMECAGYAPRLVEGAGSNIKITRPDDLELANMIMMHTTLEQAR